MSTKIAGIAGSLRRGSVNQMLLRAAAQVLAADTEFSVFDPLDREPFNEDWEADPAPLAVAQLRRLIAAADGLLIATPEYNGSIPGQLKNAVDWASRPHRAAALQGKPAAVISASPSARGAASAAADLRRVLAVAGARVIDATLAVPRAFFPVHPGRPARRPAASRPSPRGHRRADPDRSTPPSGGLTCRRGGGGIPLPRPTGPPIRQLNKEVVMTHSSAPTQRNGVPPAGRYRLDPARSSVTFRTRHLFGLGAVSGTMAAGGEITVDPAAPHASVTATRSGASFSTGNCARDIRSPRFLHPEEYPSGPEPSATPTAAGRWRASWRCAG